MFKRMLPFWLKNNLFKLNLLDKNKCLNVFGQMYERVNICVKEKISNL